jgi:hypothetical protein
VEFQSPTFKHEKSSKAIASSRRTIEKGEFQIFKDEEREDCNYAMKTSLLHIWEYTKAKREERFVPYTSKKQ